MTHTMISKSNMIQIDKWNSNASLITFDMSHINNALSQKKIDPIDGNCRSRYIKKI